MKNIKVGAWYTSSTDPEKVGTTVKGVLIGLTAVVLLLAQLLDIPITQSDWVEIAGELSAAASSIFIVYGVIQKLFVRFVVKK